MTYKRQQIAKATKRGKDAFEGGLLKAPCQDSQVMNMIMGRRVGETPEGEAATIEILEAWNKAFHTANLAN